MLLKKHCSNIIKKEIKIANLVNDIKSTYYICNTIDCNIIFCFSAVMKFSIQINLKSNLHPRLNCQILIIFLSSFSPNILNHMALQVSLGKNLKKKS